MMYNYPFFSFPNYRRYSNYYPIQPYAKHTAQNIVQNTTQNNSHYNSQLKNNIYNQYKSQSNYVNQNERKKEEIPSKKDTSKNTSGFSFLNNILHQEDRSEDEEYFELFGLKLYNDDLLLIGLIFFLYKEDVKDQYLFFALVLLLLS